MSIVVTALQQQRRDTAANWTAQNPTLLAGEIGIESNTDYIKVGDGNLPWTELNYFPGSLLEAYPLGNTDIANNAITSAKILDGTIVNADINASAGIVDTKLATISTAGKVSNSATTADSANTASAIVARNGSGNFSAGTITASLTGNVTGNLTGTASAIADNTVTSAKIVDGTIVNADINASAAIAPSKLGAGNLPSGITGSSLTSVGIIGTGTWEGTTVATDHGGTGQTTYTDGELLIGKTDGTLAKATLTASTGVTITNADGSITISATGSGGTVTGVTATSPLASTGGTTPDISIQDGTTTQKGAVQLEDSTTSTSTTTAATPAAVKAAFDLADAALPKAGGTLTGDVTLDNQSGLRFGEATANGTNYVAFQAPASIAADVTWTLPATDGTNGQLLGTNGSGTLSWQTPPTAAVSLGLVIALS
jgi:hypothetical protein